MEVMNIRLEMIQPSEMNPRKTFDQEGIQELAQNIREQGLLQPITVRPVDYYDTIDDETLESVSVVSKFEIICGERRYRACLLNGAETIPCIVKQMDDKCAFDAMITENLQRKDVDPIEEAFAFGLLVKNGSSAEDVALRFGKSVRFVQDRLRLNVLNDELQKMVKEGVLPLTAAMMVSKLDEGHQEDFVDWVKGEEMDSVPVNEVKEWIDDLFMSLDNARWIAEGNEPDWSGEFKKCSQCECNTANHGCLFYEMKGKNPQCTDAKCYERKNIAYVMYLISQHGNMVMEGEDLVQGKTVIIDEYEPYRDEDRRQKESIMSEVAAKGYRVVKPNMFSSQCWYKEDDERTKELLEKKEIYSCISVHSYGRPRFDHKYYYVKKEAKSEMMKEDPVVNEVNQLVSQHNRNIEISVDSATKTMREWATEKKLYKRKGELSDAERLAFDVVLLKGCTSEYLESVGLKKYYYSGNDDREFFEYAKNNQSERNSWIRDFIRNKLSSNDVNFSGALQACQNLVFRDAYPDDYVALGQKLTESLEKKNGKIKKRLEELGYDVHGEKLQGEA